MKRIILFFLISLCTISTTNATHMLGGEIRWECLSNGKFVFYSDLYVDCSSSAASLNYRDHRIIISGSTLPNNSSGSAINQIIVKPDSNRWANANNGDITPDCLKPGGMSYSCVNGDNGAVQWFPFVSDPIQLIGTPPVGGWTFMLISTGSNFLCCRTPYIRNLIDPGVKSLGIRAKMYRIKNPNGSSPAFLPVDICQDSSPEFVEKPVNLICRGNVLVYNQNTIDSQFDSLVYSFDYPVDHGFNIIQFDPNYSVTNQLPDQSFDSSNIPLSLNPINGTMQFAIYNGRGAAQYNTVIRVDSWRCGTKIASIWRDMPIVILDCNSLPTGKKNNSPLIRFNNSSNGFVGDTIIEIFAEDLIELDFNIFDKDTITKNPLLFQNITVEPKGGMFSLNYINQNNCPNPTASPCATISPPPLIDTITNLYSYSVNGDTGVSSKFRWQTDCKHAYTSSVACNNNQSPAIPSERNYSFIFKSYDDHCPIRAINYHSISVNVKSKPILDEPILIGASIGLDGKTTLSWVPPIDSANSFEEYDIDGASPNNGNFPGYIRVQSSVKNYQQDREFQFLNFPINLYTPIPAGKDYYFRMMTFSGCTGDIPSVWSDPVRIMELDASLIAGTEDLSLTWNKPTSSPKPTKPYFKYRSQTHYYIWQNDSASINSAMENLSNWYLRDSTTSTQFNLAENLCNQLAGFRIEARDTVITFKQGSGLQLSEYDTLSFSTFSIIDVATLDMSKPSVDHQFLESISASVQAESYQWYDCNTNLAIQNENQRAFIPLDTGKFKVKIGNRNCFKESACFNITAVLNDSVTQIDNQTLQGANVNQKFQWIDCRADTIIPGATNRLFVPSDTGYYAVVVSAYGYNDTSRCVPMIAIGLLENQFENGLSVSPNPTTGELFIESKKQKMNKIRLFNLNGQLLQDFNINSKFSIRINLEASQGIYILEIESVSGQKVYQKIIKQ